LQEGQQEKQVKPVKQQSLELEKQKEDLKHFHKTFNVRGGSHLLLWKPVS